MYSRKQFDKHIEALDAAEQCISASVAGSEYGVRLKPFIDDYTEIACLFWAKCPVTRKKMPQAGEECARIAWVLHRLTCGHRFSGIEVVRDVQPVIERAKRKCRGALLGTRMILADKDKKGSCADEENHTQPCMCKPLSLANLAKSRDLANDYL